MSLIIQRMLCRHKWRPLTAITVTCEKCGKLKNIPCCHKWEEYTKANVQDDWGGLYSMSTLVCKNCGKIKKVKDI